MKRVIPIFEVSKTDTLRSRTLAKEILENTNLVEFTIDFNKISFISKSFAHELLSTIENQNKDVNFINKSKSVEAMLKVALNKPSIEIKPGKILPL